MYTECVDKKFTPYFVIIMLHVINPTLQADLFPKMDTGSPKYCKQTFTRV